MIKLILQGIIPVVFVIVLGFYAGRKKFISDDGAKNFSTLILNFALPCLLFVNIFDFTPTQLENVSFILTLALSLIIPFVFAIIIGVWIFKTPIAEAGLFASNCGFPDMAFFGLPVLVALAGTKALLPVIMGDLVGNVLILPVIIFMSQQGVTTQHGRKPKSFLHHLLSTLEQPIVWAPILGLVLVLMRISLPSLVSDSLRLFGRATGGVALFTLGVLLSRLKFRMDRSIVAVIILKNLVMPALALGLSLLFHLQPPLAIGAIIAMACPCATLGGMLSAKLQIGQNTIPAQILASNIFGVASMAFWIFIAEKIG